MMIQTFNQRLRNLFMANTSPLRWCLGWVGIVCGVGFLISSSLNNNYEMLTDLAPPVFWGISFLVYGVSTAGSCLFRQSNVQFYAASVYGLWLWCYLFLSFVIFDKTPFAATELMLFVPLIIEVWAIAERLSGVRSYHSRRN